MEHLFRKRQRNKKRYAEFDHFHFRCKQRLGYNLCRREFEKLRNNYISIYNQSNRVAHYLVENKGLFFKIVWDRHRHVPITVILPEVWYEAKEIAV